MLVRADQSAGGERLTVLTSFADRVFRGYDRRPVDLPRESAEAPATGGTPRATEWQGGGVGGAGHRKI